MLNRKMTGLLAAGLLSAGAIGCFAAEVIFPQQRQAFYVNEQIELAVAGLAAGETVDIKLQAANAKPVSFRITGDGSTPTLALPPNSLAPGAYDVMLGDESMPATQFHISRGVWPSAMLVSQTGKGYKNFTVSNAFNFGIRDRKDPTQPADEPRRPGTLKRYEALIKDDIPSLIYMYWTGYVLHKPWGIHKEWASADMIENMRMFNYHVAQRLRRFDHLLFSIGSLDEPGLPWGRTAAGGSASGFTGWNVADWMRERGLEWTDDPGSLGEADFRKYMQLRALMLREAFQQCQRLCKDRWPGNLLRTRCQAVCRRQ